MAAGFTSVNCNDDGGRLYRGWLVAMVTRRKPAAPGGHPRRYATPAAVPSAGPAVPCQVGARGASLGFAPRRGPSRGTGAAEPRRWRGHSADAGEGEGGGAGAGRGEAEEGRGWSDGDERAAEERRRRVMPWPGERLDGMERYFSMAIHLLMRGLVQ